MNDLQELAPAEFALARPLFEPFTHHLAIESILASLTPGRVFVDNRTRPRTAVAWFKRRIFLSGDRSRPEINHALHQLLTTSYFADAQRQGFSGGAFTLVYTPGWDRVIGTVLADIEPLQRQRLCYTLDPNKQTWTPAPPPEFTLRPVNADLLADPQLSNLEYVTEEMVSERPSVADFLAKSFGYCLVRQGRIVGWCMSEYNIAGRCELGIETAAEFRRRGLARTLATAVIQTAVNRGYHEIGWIADADNQPSVALAQNLGFHLKQAYDTFYAFFDPVINRGVHGNVHFSQKQFEQALVWYQKAQASGPAPVWILWNTACAHANLHAWPEAIATLHQAIDAGFDDRAHLENSEHFQPLHNSPDWPALLARLNSESARML